LKGYADGRAARSGIVAWFAHQALGHRTPMAVWREGTSGPLGAKVVDCRLDMMDNAIAFPTCPAGNSNSGPSQW
jgi:putative transposase